MAVEDQEEPGALVVLQPVDSSLRVGQCEGNRRSSDQCRSSHSRAGVRGSAPVIDDARTYWLRAGAVTGLGAIAVQEVFDFTLQMPGAAVLFVVLAAVAIHSPHQVARRSRPLAM